MKNSVLLLSLALALALALSLFSGCISDEEAPADSPESAVTTSVLETQAAPDDENEALARTFCCVVHMDPPVICHQWHTSAVWAGTKCVAAGVGLNRRGSSLYRSSCSAFPQC